VNSTKKDPHKKPARSARIPCRGQARAAGSLACLGLSLTLAVLLYCVPARAQSQQQPPPPPATPASPAQLPAQPSAQLPNSITGTIVDPSGAAVTGARVKLTHENQATTQEALSGDDGQFSLTDVSPGPFQLTITAPGLGTEVVSGILHREEIYTVPQTTLALATATSQVLVTLPQEEIAEVQIQEEEKQRVLGVVPNFYVTYIPHAAPLTSKQKFKLAWRSTIDPATVIVVGGIAGIQQAQDDFSGYGQGAQGYAKRFGANYADLVTGTFIGSAILPSLLKQDPRYFYKGSGSTRSRILYALANAVVCKGDNSHWQANYSNILGSIASGGISNLYYPASNRDGAELTFENAAIGIGATAAANLLQEFVIRKLTPNVPTHTPATP
jgi:hypothetical protein